MFGTKNCRENPDVPYIQRTLLINIYHVPDFELVIFGSPRTTLYYPTTLLPYDFLMYLNPVVPPPLAA